ncbi:MAG: anti-sigma factor, partial [Bacteroidota bacterium]
ALLFAALAYYYFSSKNACEAATATLQQTNERLVSDYQESQVALSQAEQRLRDATNPASKGIILAGTDKVPNSAAYVIYNPTLNKTYFKATNLPPPPTGKQYQLWAIDATGPNDLGVLDLDLDSDTLLEVPHLPNVAAFAITLEDTGGKPTPDLEHLQVIGNVQG